MSDDAIQPSCNSDEQIVDRVRERYGEIAAGKSSGCGCSCAAGAERTENAVARAIGYSAGELAEVPEEANLGLGCGAPIPYLRLVAGETVVDLGSGAGIDAFLAVREVGSGGRVIGVDMTPEMLARARAGAAEYGYANVEFREGRLEALPIADASIDAITSNCVINLVPDKGAVFREIARVLKPGGRLVISDILLDGDLPPAIANDVLAYIGCVAGAMRRERYFELLAASSLTDLEVLRDSDVGLAYAAAAPAEANALFTQLGLTADSIRGVVRSVTYRARKSA